MTVTPLPLCNITAGRSPTATARGGGDIFPGDASGGGGVQCGGGARGGVDVWRGAGTAVVAVGAKLV